MLKEMSAASNKIKWPEQDNKIPREIYLDEDLYHSEMDRIFGGPAWHMVAHEAEIPNKGDFKTTDLGNIPIIILRDMEDEIQVLVNSCAHRGARVVLEEYGNLAKQKCLTCIYHHWNFNLDGSLKSVALPEDFPVDFTKEQYGLTKARVETYKGAVFATLSDETPPLREYLGEMSEGIDRTFGDGKLKLLGFHKVVLDCNWKAYMENIYDGYHAIVLHKAFHMLKVKNVGGTYFAPEYEKYGHVWFEFKSLPPEEKILNDMSLVEIRTRAEHTNRVMNVFPTNIIGEWLDVIGLRFVIPRAVNKTEVQFTVFARQSDSEEIVNHRIAQGSNLLGPEGFISLEDASALIRVQQGATARGENVVLKGTVKRFPPYRHVDEAAIRHFYGAYRRLMDL